MLVNKDAVEEAKFYVKGVEISSQNNLNVLEMLGFLYMIPNMSKLDPKHLETAKKKFNEIILLDSDVDAAYYGLGEY